MIPGLLSVSRPCSQSTALTRPDVAYFSSRDQTKFPFADSHGAPSESIQCLEESPFGMGNLLGSFRSFAASMSLWASLRDPRRAAEFGFAGPTARGDPDRR